MSAVRDRPWGFISLNWTLLAGILASPHQAVGQHPLLMLPLNDPAYAQLEALDRVGCRAGRVSPFRPFFVGDVRESLGGAANDPACPALIVDALQRRFFGDTSSAEIAQSLPPLPALPTATNPPPGATPPAPRDTIVREGLSGGAAATLRVTALGRGEFRPLWRDVRPDSLGDPPAVAMLRGRARYSGGPRFLAVAELYLQSSRQNDPTVRAKTVRGSQGFLDVGESYLNAKWGPVTASFGRAAEAWYGGGRESLVLSANGPAMDRVVVSGRWRRVQGRAFAGVLNDVLVTEQQDSLAPGTGSALFHRGLVGHALTWFATPAIELSAGETMLFARRSGLLDLAYLNPVIPYIISQNDTGRATQSHDNLLVFGGARLRAGPAILSGEFLVDDIQVDKTDRARTADQLAYWMRGSTSLGTLQPTVATFEYRRIWSVTYSRPLYSEVYQNYDAPLGSELGPDADYASGELETWPNGVFTLSTGFAWWRHGATRIDRRPSESPNYHAGLPFPSTRSYRPAVQHSFGWGFGARLLTAVFPVTAKLEVAKMDNVNNQPTAAALYLRGVVFGTYEFQYP